MAVCELFARRKLISPQKNAGGGRKLFAHSPDLKQAYVFREQLSDIFKQALSTSSAIWNFKTWIKRVQHSNLTCFDVSIKTLHIWMEEICYYFINRDTCGFVEGFNNKVKLLKRWCYRFFILQHLFLRLYLVLEGYRQFAH
jgi:transposase